MRKREVSGLGSVGILTRDPPGGGGRGALGVWVKELFVLSLRLFVGVCWLNE